MHQKFRLTDSESSVLSIILDVLTSFGWVIADGVAIATKDYDSAVGPKRAFVYLSGNENYFLCTSNYESQGNNILSTCTILCEKKVSAVEVANSAKEFAEAIEATVADSYAVRLLRKYGR